MLCDTTYHFQPNPILESIFYKSRVNIQCDKQGMLEENIEQYCTNQIEEIKYYFVRFSRNEDILLCYVCKGIRIFQLTC